MFFFFFLERLACTAIAKQDFNPSAVLLTERVKKRQAAFYLAQSMCSQQQPFYPSSSGKQQCCHALNGSYHATLVNLKQPKYPKLPVV